MAALTLLLPTMRRLAADGASDLLVRWIFKGDRAPDAKPGRDAALRECFEFIGTDIPVAALTRSLDSSDASGMWLRADPCHVAADAVVVRMLACGNMELSASESDELSRALRPLFGDAGFALEPSTPERWYLRCPPGAQLPHFDSPDLVLGDDLSLHMPAGESGKRWRYLLNETQVTLHHHPVNTERARRGLPTVNSLWFWGAGTLPEWVRSRFKKVFSRDDVAIALARLAKCDAGAEKLDFERLDGDVLFDLDHRAIAETMRRTWLESIAAMLRRRRIDAVYLMFASGERVTVKRSHRWRFWRARRPIAA